MSILLIILAIILFPISIAALILMLCWNVAAVAIFAVPAITFWQSFGLVVLLGFIKGIFSINITTKK